MGQLRHAGAAVTEWLFGRRPNAGSCCTSYARDAAGLADGAGCRRRSKRSVCSGHSHHAPLYRVRRWTWRLSTPRGRCVPKYCTVGGQRVPHNGPLSPRYTFTFSQTVSQLFHIPPEYSPPGATQISIVASEIHMEIHVHVYLLSRSVQLSVRETCACRSGHRGRAASCDAAYTRTPLSMHHGMHPPPVPDQRRHTHARTRHTLEFNTTGSRRHLHIRCTSDYTTSPCRSHWLSYPRRRCSPAQLAGHPRLTSSWP